VYEINMNNCWNYYYYYYIEEYNELLFNMYINLNKLRTTYNTFEQCGLSLRVYNMHQVPFRKHRTSYKNVKQSS